MQNPHELYDLLLDGVAASQDRVAEILVGMVWTMCRTDSGAIGLAMTPQQATRTLEWPGSLAGRPVAELATWVRSWDPYQASIGMAVVNAVVNADANPTPRPLPRVDGVPGNLNVFEWFLPYLRNRKVAVIGRYPGLEHYQRQLDMAVLELAPGATDLPAQACEYVLRESDWVFLTASSIPNKTFPRLAELSRDANLVLMGPTTPWLPELAEFGVDYLAGVQVSDPSALRQTLAEGGGRRIFDHAVQYQVMDLGLSEMDWLGNAIASMVAHREKLTMEMASWYSGAVEGSFPKIAELERVDHELSSLDSRFKRIWDLHHTSCNRESMLHLVS